MTDLAQRLRTKANMINMGERIAFGSETALMFEAADELTSLRQQVAVLRGCLQVEAERSTSEITRAHAQARLAEADRIAKGEV